MLLQKERAWHLANFHASFTSSDSARAVCRWPTSYSARPGLEQPPYVYADTIEPKAAAALWCHEQGQPEGHYTLLFRRGRGSVGQGGCARVIRGQTYIGGLSLVTGYKSPLSSFSRVGDLSQNGPADARVSGLVIRTEYDGVAREYYCYRGIWFERAFD